LAASKKTQVNKRVLAKKEKKKEKKREKFRQKEKFKM
jgi:hypothetical protein